jgi:predicted DNA-binding protein (MmcQ/YjbR family)
MSATRSDALFERPVFKLARKTCLALPETTETASWNHPNFKAGKRTYCAFEVIAGRPSIAFKLPSTDPALASLDSFATPYGRGAWTSVWVDTEIDRAAIFRLVERSYRAAATKRMIDRLDATGGR